MAINHILIVDDNETIRNFLAETLKRQGLDVTTASCGKEALSLLKKAPFDLVLTDMCMEGISGIDILRKVKELSPATFVVVITGFGSIENAVEAMRLGAFHYLLKPFSPETVEGVIAKANEQLLSSNTKSPSDLPSSEAGLHTSSALELVSASPIMHKISADLERIAKSSASVFIYGESGTGKEVVAQTIHHHSLRYQKPFIKVNCAAVPETLIESEFFGHEKGAFTGATARRQGRFELADGGTLLLDEITEIPLGVQAKLLRAIQEHEFERVGGTKSVKVDVRLISTSNRDISEAIAQKILREDLYYRLNVIPIYLPPLRERPDDIIPLAEHFLAKLHRETYKDKLKKLSAESKQKLLDYPWPGNARELANVIERAVVMDSDEIIAPEHLNLETVGLTASRAGQR
jgi:two-component system response regulator AtoC